MTKASVPLQSLPLRPSALGILLRAGFRTADDVRSSSRSGLGNFAAECSVGLSEAGRLRREVEEAAAAASTTGTSTNATAAAGQIRPRPGSSRRITAAALLTNPHAASSADSNASSGRSSSSGQNIRHIVTFCRSIDALLGGGIALSELTELSGAPGSGKTQLAMQLCIDARLPPAYGGVGGQAVYVDTEGSFSSERCWDMAEALVRHVRRSAERRARAASAGAGGSNASSTNANASADLPEWFTPTSILDGIHVLRVHDLAAQQAAVHNLSALLRSKVANGETPIKAVVIDSVAFHYRSEPGGGGGSSSYGGRTKSLTRLAASLADLAREFDVAVLAVNQMTTKVQGGSGGFSGSGGPLGENSANGGATSMSSRLTPALGESWSHATTTRLLLTQVTQRGDGGIRSESGGGGDLRRCRLVKCPHKAAGVADFQVNEDGVRDVAVAAVNASNANAPGGSGQQGTAAVEQAKRQRVQ